MEKCTCPDCLEAAERRERDMSPRTITELQLKKTRAMIAAEVASLASLRKVERQLVAQLQSGSFPS